MEQVARIGIRRLTVIGTEAQVLANEPGFSYTNPEVFDIFNFQWLAGIAATALTQLYSVVLTASAARRYFADADPTGNRCK